jgi:hypothetical protein
MAARARKTMDNQIKQNKIIVNGDQVVGLFVRRRTRETLDEDWSNRSATLFPTPDSWTHTHTRGAEF